MEAVKEEPRQSVEPQFLSQALASGATLRVGQMNRTEYEGVLREVGRYEINLESAGAIITLLKQEISCITAPHPLLIVVAEPSAAAGPDGPRPNVQQDFLDKAIKENQQLTLFLINGQRVRAQIEAYDSFTLLLREGTRQHLYYKHAITTINR